MRGATAVGIAAASVAACGAGTRAVAADPAGTPGLRVTMTDDTHSAHSGDVIAYTVRVENDSPTDYPRLQVFQLVPNGFQLVDSTPAAEQSGSNIRWTGDVPAGHAAVFTDLVMAGTVEESEHLAPQTRNAKPLAGDHAFSSTACARAGAAGPAIACGTVRQQLANGPGGAPAAAAAKHWQPGLLGIGLLAALFAGLRGIFRKRKEPVGGD